ncbi:MAG: class fumarate hydratase [Pseudomonadota bacterium]
MDRWERDSFGDIAVADERLWGAQTQRSLRHFAISTERMPTPLLTALAQVKRACAVVNQVLGRLPADKSAAIVQAADEVIAGRWPEEFPLSIWQTGSGTQTNMNMNEVLANRGSELMGGGRGALRRLHPNDDVNLGQSSNDVFPTAMHVAAALAVEHQLLPALRQVINTLQDKATRYASLVKLGRTHLQDATPLTLGQEFSGHVAQLMQAEQALCATQPGLLQLAIGGTAVGTGLNTHVEFGARVAAELAVRCGLPFHSAPNKFAALAGHEAAVAAHGALKVLACALTKLANDLRWLSSGPRAGLGELLLPENEPGSSIMPGKVNPTQPEAVLMLCCQVMGNDVTLGIAAASGNFELNVAKPVIAHVHMQSLRLLADGLRSLDEHCLQGMVANETRIADSLASSLMLVTALVPQVGYDAAARIAKLAHQRQGSLRDAALESGVSADDFDRWVRPEAMTRPDPE